MPRSQPLRRPCKYHCGECGRHFSSLDAFDLHKHHNAAGWPHCVDPVYVVDRKGTQRLEVASTDGQCNIYDRQVGVTIWTVAGSRESFQRWQAKREAGYAA
jgi:hypothetical protein